MTFPAGLPQAIEDVTGTGGDHFVLAAGHTWLDPAGGAVLLMSSDRCRTWRLPTGLGDPSDFLTFAVAAALSGPAAALRAGATLRPGPGRDIHLDQRRGDVAAI